jgi:Tol biopolymer transport system component
MNKAGDRGKVAARTRALLAATTIVVTGCSWAPLVTPRPVADDDAARCAGAKPTVDAAKGWAPNERELAANGAIMAERYDPMGDKPASIVRIDPHTGAERQIMTLESKQEPFAVSPDAESMAVVDTRPSSYIWGTELKIVSVDGDDVRDAYSADEYVRGLAWSPDSTSVAFLADDRIHRLELADLSVTEIGDAPTDQTSQGYREMRWSRDGRWLAFSGNNYQAIHIVPSDGSKGPTLFAEGYGFDWSPEGAELAFLHFDGLSAAQADGTGPRDLIVEDPHLPLTEARWRPDGQAIAVVIGEWDPGELCMLGAERGMHSVTGSVDLEGRVLDWSPDGTRLLFGVVDELPDGYDRSVATIAASGGGVQTIGRNLLYPQWIQAE